MKKVTFLFLIIITITIFTLTSCISTGPAGTKDGAGSSSAAADTTSAQSKDTYSPREKVVIPADSSSPETLLQNTMPYQSRPVFLGIASRMRNRDEEMQVALENAASQVSKYLKIWGKADFLKQKSSDGVGYIITVESNYDKAQIPSIAEQLSVVTEYQDNRGTYILTEYDRPMPVPIKINLKPGSGTPEWVNKPPDIPGYIVGVGVAQAKRTLMDSIESVDEKAFEEILKQIAIEIKLLDESQSIDRVGTNVESTSLESAQGEIEGFYVLSRTVSPDGRYYYCLAVCPDQNFND